MQPQARPAVHKCPLAQSPAYPWTVRAVGMRMNRRTVRAVGGSASESKKLGAMVAPPAG